MTDTTVLRKVKAVEEVKTRRRSYFGRWSIIGAVFLSTAAVLSAPPAEADQTGDAFIATLEKHGLVVADAPAFIAMGRAACSRLDKGQKPAAAALSVAKDTDLSPHEAGYFIASSINSYCPQHKNLLPRQSEQPDNYPS
jgi:hypothetical protein